MAGFLLGFTALTPYSALAAKSGSNIAKGFKNAPRSTKPKPTIVLKKPFGGQVPQPIRVGNFRLPGQVVGTNVNVATTSGMRKQFWAGVNLGATLPGTSPGELAPKRADYDRWLQQMGELGATSVRIYTILKPDFYDALRAYNLAHTQDPIFVLAGVWVPEDEMLHTQNAYDPDVVARFRAELADAVAAVHGDLVRPVKIGQASGTFTSDISPWVIAYSIGVEWDPGVVQSTNRLNPTSNVNSSTGLISKSPIAAANPASRSESAGTYITSTLDANPMERWIASMLDHVAILEAKRGWSRPLTHTNWVTADPLRHPQEPFGSEDLIAIDAKHMAATPAWPGGFFASYHAYPYYPDGLRFQTDYLNYKRPATQQLDAYAGYINALAKHHGDQAVMITEFGQPSSIGIAHRGPNDRYQGGHSEQQAGVNNADLMRIIAEEGLAGGMVFEWLDEWFKFTWNSVEHELPKDRRSMWRNPLTNEEHFGILAIEAGATQKVVLDGKDAEWTRKQSQVILESRGPISEVRATHDEESLYLRIRFTTPKSGTEIGRKKLGKSAPEPWAKEELAVGLQLFPEPNKGLPGRPGVSPESNVAILIGPGNTAKLRIASWTDPVQFEFGVALKELKFDPAHLVPGSGAWSIPQQIVSRALTIPTTKEQLAIDTIPFGELRWGTTDPNSANFDDRALVNGSKNVLELRIPWGMIGLSDPSSKLLLRPKPDGTLRSETIERIGINVVGPGGIVAKTTGYNWEVWNRVTWHERKKAGWPFLQKAFDEYR